MVSTGKENTRPRLHGLGGHSDVSKIFDGRREMLVSHPGTSQYASGGVSACGLASFNAARMVLNSPEKGEDLLHAIAKWETAEEILGICRLWTQSNTHLEVEEIAQVPLFQKSIALVSTSFGKPEFLGFQSVLRELQSATQGTTPAALIITRPPEIVACLKVPTPKGDAFVIFDSHPRPKHPNGAGFTFSASLDTTARCLADLLAVDKKILTDESLQWQAQLLSSYSGHIFVPRPGANDPLELTHTIMESSLAILALQAQMSAIKSENSVLEAENKRLEGMVEEMEDGRREDRRRLRQLEKGKDKERQASTPISAVTAKVPRPPLVNAAAGPSRSKDASVRQNTGRSPQPERDYYRNANSWHIGSTGSPSKPQRPRDHPTSRHDAMDVDEFRRPSRTHPTPSQAEREQEMYAIRIQQELTAEEERIIGERQALSTLAQVTFECGVCFEEHPLDDVCSVDGCSHSFCRDCMRGYVSSKIAEQRFPISCPTCTANREAREPGAVSNRTVEQIGISEKEYAMFIEMQLAAFSILLHCRRCQNSAFVDRVEYEEARELTCPLPNCNYSWCKSCQRQISFDGPRHSCDGSTELEALMSQRGWKACPGCKTNIERASGCNHMTCVAPGCNTHFCYVCGDLIIKSLDGRQIKSATSLHYRRCRLFDEVADRGVPPW